MRNPYERRRAGGLSLTWVHQGRISSQVLPPGRPATVPQTLTVCNGTGMFHTEGHCVTDLTVTEKATKGQTQIPNHIARKSHMASDSKYSYFFSTPPKQFPTICHKNQSSPQSPHASEKGYVYHFLFQKAEKYLIPYISQPLNCQESGKVSH